MLPKKEYDDGSIVEAHPILQTNCKLPPENDVNLILHTLESPILANATILRRMVALCLND